MSVNTSAKARLSAIGYVFTNDRGTLLADVIEHFLKNRFEELTFVSSNSNDVLMSSLQADAMNASTNGYDMIVDIDHLKRWAVSLSAAPN
jgi:hypothetical protein